MFPHGHCHLEYFLFAQCVTLLPVVHKVPERLSERSPGHPVRTHQDICWSLGAGGKLFGKPARRQGGRREASLQWQHVQSPQRLPCQVAGESQGSLVTCTVLSTETGIFLSTAELGYEQDRPAAGCPAVQSVMAHLSFH